MALSKPQFQLQKESLGPQGASLSDDAATLVRRLERDSLSPLLSLEQAAAIAEDVLDPNAELKIAFDGATLSGVHGWVEWQKLLRTVSHWGWGRGPGDERNVWSFLAQPQRAKLALLCLPNPLTALNPRLSACPLPPAPPPHTLPQSFPDMVTTLLHSAVVEEGPAVVYVATKWQRHGTFMAPLLGVAPTLRPVCLTGMSLYKVRRATGRIVHGESFYDLGPFFAQLGREVSIPSGAGGGATVAAAPAGAGLSGLSALIARAVPASLKPALASAERAIAEVWSGGVEKAVASVGERLKQATTGGSSAAPGGSGGSVAEAINQPVM
jgi:hypothetical protein